MEEDDVKFLGRMEGWKDVDLCNELVGLIFFFSHLLKGRLLRVTIKASAKRFRFA
jgi:hypothetical protein